MAEILHVQVPPHISGEEMMTIGQNVYKAVTAGEAIVTTPDVNVFRSTVDGDFGITVVAPITLEVIAKTAYDVSRVLEGGGPDFETLTTEQIEFLVAKVAAEVRNPTEPNGLNSSLFRAIVSSLKTRLPNPGAQLLQVQILDEDGSFGRQIPITELPVGATFQIANVEASPLYRAISAPYIKYQGSLASFAIDTEVVPVEQPEQPTAENEAEVPADDYDYELGVHKSDAK